VSPLSCERALVDGQRLLGHPCDRELLPGATEPVLGEHTPALRIVEERRQVLRDRAVSGAGY